LRNKEDLAAHPVFLILGVKTDDVKANRPPELEAFSVGKFAQGVDAFEGAGQWRANELKRAS